MSIPFISVLHVSVGGSGGGCSGGGSGGGASVGDFVLNGVSVDLYRFMSGTSRTCKPHVHCAFLHSFSTHYQTSWHGPPGGMIQTSNLYDMLFEGVSGTGAHWDTLLRYERHPVQLCPATLHHHDLKQFPFRIPLANDGLVSNQGLPGISDLEEPIIRGLNGFMTHVKLEIRLSGVCHENIKSCESGGLAQSGKRAESR